MYRKKQKEKRKKIIIISILVVSLTIGIIVNIAIPNRNLTIFEKTIKDRLHTYEINTKPLINYYDKQSKLKNINADENTSIDELVEEAIKYTV